MTLLSSDVLHMLVRYASPSGPMYLILTLSGPVELLFLLCFIADWIFVVSVRFCCLQPECPISRCLFVLCVLCLTVLVNCLPTPCG